MNSGNYLYTNPATKKASNSKKVKVSLCLFITLLSQKPQLKYINNETISHFKKLIYFNCGFYDNNVINKHNLTLTFLEFDAFFVAGFV